MGGESVGADLLMKIADGRFLIGSVQMIKVLNRQSKNSKNRKSHYVAYWKEKQSRCRKASALTVKEQELEVKGPKGTLKTPIPAGITFKLEGR